MRFLNPKNTWVFVLPEDEALPEAQRTKWHLCTLNVDEETYLQDRLGSMNDEGMSIKLGTQDLIALHIGLDKVETPEVDEAGNPIVFERDQTKAFVFGKKRPWRSDCLSRIPKESRGKIAKAILEGPKLKEAEVKN